MQEHKLKCSANYFDAIARGEKLFEVRRDDRGFQKGDVIVLQRLLPNSIYIEYDFTGKVKQELRVQVTYILTGGQLGIEPGYVVMGIALI